MAVNFIPASTFTTLAQARLLGRYCGTQFRNLRDGGEGELGEVAVFCSEDADVGAEGGPDGGVGGTKEEGAWGAYGGG